MQRESTDGIVLQKRDYRETDSIVALYTLDFGKISGIGFGARKSRKRFANCLDLFCKSRVEFVFRPHSELARLERCLLIDGRPSLREGEKPLAYAAYLVDLVSRLTPAGDAQRDVFHLLDAGLDRLGEDPAHARTARVFEVRLLTLLGYRIELESCTVCGNPADPQKPSGFSASRGGIVCSSCMSHARRTLSPGTLRALRFAQREPIESVWRLRLSPGNLREAKAALHDVLLLLLRKRPQTMTYIDRMEHEETA